jgi:hypothetical protein
MQRCIQTSVSACCDAPDDPYLWIIGAVSYAIDN